MLPYVRDAVSAYINDATNVRFIEISHSPLIARGSRTHQITTPKRLQRERMQAYSDDEVAVDLGIFYLRGDFTNDPNPEEGAAFIRRAHDMGNPAATGILGNLYLRGTETIPKNETRAKELYKMSADKGDPVGLNGLGVCYRKGTVVDKNLDTALDLLTVAADFGQIDSLFQIAMIYKELEQTSDAAAFFQAVLAYHHVWAAYEYARMLEQHGSCNDALAMYFTASHMGPTRLLEDRAYAHYVADEVAVSALLYLQAGWQGSFVGLDNLDAILTMHPEIVQRAGQHDVDPQEVMLRLRLDQYHSNPFDTRAAVHVASMMVTHPDLAAVVMGLDPTDVNARARDILSRAAGVEGASVRAEAAFLLAKMHLAKSATHNETTTTDEDDLDLATGYLDVMFNTRSHTILLWAVYRTVAAARRLATSKLARGVLAAGLTVVGITVTTGRMAREDSTV